MPGIAHSIGCEMSGLALVVPMLLILAAASLLLIMWLLQRALSGSWSSARRWLVAAVMAPLAMGFVLLILSGPSVFERILTRFLLN